MVAPSTYTINFTDPGKPVISIGGGLKNGPGKAAQRTDLMLIGQFAPLYGEDVNENFIHILEHFSYANPPSTPIEGQLWHSSNPSYDHRSLSAPTSPPYRGDFHFRVRSYNNTTLDWVLPRCVVVDDNIINRTSYSPLPGDLWFDTKPNWTMLDGPQRGDGTGVIPVPDRQWDHSELKIYDATTHKFESIGRNYIKQNDPGTQTITSDLHITGGFNVTLNANINNQLSTSTLIVSSTSSFGDDATFNQEVIISQNLYVQGTLDITGATTFRSGITIINNSSLTSNGNATFINGYLSSLNVTNNTTSDTLTITHNASIGTGLAIGSNTSLTNLAVTGSTTMQGNLNIYGVGYGNLTVSGTTALSTTTTGGLTVTGTLVMATDTIFAHNIDMLNTKIVNLAPPTDPLDAANRQYIDDNYLRRNDVLGASYNTMSAVLVLSNPNQNYSSIYNAATVGYVDYNSSLKVNKGGDTVSGQLNLSSTGQSLDVYGYSNFRQTITADSIIVNHGCTINAPVYLNEDVHFASPGQTINLNGGMMYNLYTSASPSYTDAANCGYVQDAVAPIHNNFTRINSNVPKNGDIKYEVSPDKVFVYVNGWKQVYPAQYS